MMAIHANVANGSLCKKVHRGAPVNAVINVLFREPVAQNFEAPRSAIARVTGFGRSTIVGALRGADRTPEVNTPYPQGVTRDRIDEDRLQILVDYIDEYAPMRSHPSVRILRMSLDDFYEKYRQYCFQVRTYNFPKNPISYHDFTQRQLHPPSEPFSMPFFRKILFRNRVWRRSNLDYDCPHCIAAKDPNHANHQAGLAHLALIDTQRGHYFDCKALLQYDFPSKIQLIFLLKIVVKTMSS